MEIEGPEDSPIFDMNALQLNFDKKRTEENAHRYWSGKPLNDDLAYTPYWECLLWESVSVVKEISEIDLLSKMYIEYGKTDA